MLAFFFALPPFTILLVFAVVGLFLAVAGVGALRYLSVHARHDAFTIPAPAFLGTIATAWALSMGFVAADAWSLNSRADLAVSQERSAILRLLDTANPLVLDNDALRAAVLTYRTRVAEGEWGSGRNVEPAADVDQAILIIRSIVQKLALAGTPGPIVSQLVSDFDELQDARNARLAIANTSVDEYKWYLVLFLTTLTAVTISAIHADRVIAGRRALALYILTASVSLWILASHANPYGGAGELKPDLLFTTHR